ncbi:type VII secretion protein EccB [Actinomadura barringtoniae]|uniref:Type VII secretion protein EccB n=1 Tax=Actinomadura barringtoniae TaxID=1427535 RepID=A0A939PBZ8_9ACTN|nr:type VII secretion protein EccB [Actinomadura barringtoniae]MBO2447273.1 type VII secretion protein EccB [Actinomadura barringtoniae]
MQTRKDLYQAHKLMTQRVALALLQGQPGAAESPLRRTWVGTFCGVMVVVLVATGFGISGLLFKGGARHLEEPGLVIIEKETGASYSYSAQDHKLIPFLNYASARLAMSTTTVKRKLVSSRSLAKYPRGAMTGIQGAPESLPDPGKLSRGPWSLCVRNAGVGDSRVSLIGGHDVGGRPLTDQESILVRSGPQLWVVWHNERLRITPQAARSVFPFQPVAVDQRWLNGLPQGPDYAAPPLTDPGKDRPGPDGSRSFVGEVFLAPAVAGSAERYFVLLDDGLAGITKTQAGLLIGAFPNALRNPKQISLSAAAGQPSRTNLLRNGLPDSPPSTVTYDPATPLCAVYTGTGKLSTDARFTIGGTLPDARTSQGNLDQVVLSGGATFAGTLSGPGQRPQAFAIITDQGIRYPIPTADEVAKLGYSTDKAVPVPADILQLFREGPILSTAAALRPVSAT